MIDAFRTNIGTSSTETLNTIGRSLLTPARLSDWTVGFGHPFYIQNPIMFGPKMVDSILKEAKELLKEKENETTWFKVFTVFEKLQRLMRNKEEVCNTMPHVTDLLLRSLQSDRTRLNGMSLDFLRSCAAIAQTDYSFNTFVPILIRLTGKANKVFVTRAMDVMYVVCKYVNMKCILKTILDFIDSPNKNVRFAVYKIIEMRLQEARDTFSAMVEKGLKDPALEVRSICKEMSAMHIEERVSERLVKKVILPVSTPRKSCKTENSAREVKSSENTVVRAVKEQMIAKPISSDFFEKLNQLKKERKPIFERKDYDLTPRRLDKYLDKYRTKSPVDLKPMKTESISIVEALSQSTPALFTRVDDEIKTSRQETENVTDSAVDVCESIHDTENIQETLANQATFLQETLFFKNELGSSSCNDGTVSTNECEENISITHRPADCTVHLEIPGSDKSPTTPNDVEISDDNASIMDEPQMDLSFCAPPCVSELSHSFANMSIEPSVVMRDASPEMVRCSTIVANSPIPGDDARKCLDLINKDDLQLDIQSLDSAEMELESQWVNIVKDKDELYDARMVDTSNNEPFFKFEHTENNTDLPICHLKRENITLVLDEKETSLVDVLADLEPFLSLGHFEDNIESFIDKCEQSVECRENTICIGNLNSTVVINTIENRDPSDVFRQGTEINRHSCVELFNEQIFSSDEEEVYLKRSSIPKERPSFIIDIPVELNIDGGTMNTSQCRSENLNHEGVGI